MMFAIIPIAAAFYHGHAAINARWRGRRLLAEIGLLLLAGPLSTVLLPALVDGRAFNTGVLLFPVQYGDGRCDTFALENILNSRHYYGDRPRLIMNMMDQGPEILFRTRHMALGGGYHMNVRGNLDSVHFFNATDPNEAEKVVPAAQRRSGGDVPPNSRPVSRSRRPQPIRPEQQRQGRTQAHRQFR